MHSIRARNRGAAQKLLNALLEYPSRVRWTKEGVLYIDGQPSGQLRELLKKTFYTTLKYPIEGQLRWFSLLKELSLDKYFTNRSRYGVQDRKAPFYFIGP